jgi:hypothetical protein
MDMIIYFCIAIGVSLGYDIIWLIIYFHPYIRDELSDVTIDGDENYIMQMISLMGTFVLMVYKLFVLVTYVNLKRNPPIIIELENTKLNLNEN